MYEIFELLCKNHGITTYQFCKETGVNSSTISTWKKNKTVARPKLANIVCEYFGVSHDFLMTGEDATEKEAKLTQRDERDIKKHLDMFKKQLLEQEGLMFDGEPATPEAIESILAAMQIGMEMAKKKNKERFTPKKYRKKDSNNDNKGQSL